MREQGYEIDSAPNRGYRLRQSLNLPSELEIKPLLTTRYFGRRLRFLAEVDSTNAFAAELARNDAPEGTVVVADTQTAGRGRLQRQWHSPPGQNLYFSVILRPQVMPNRAPQLALVTGLALCRALRGMFPDLDPRAKWPNDVYLEGRKLAGILCAMVSEMERVHHLIVGIGVNVNVTDFPAEIADRATSLQLATHNEISRPELLAAILGDLERAYDQWLEAGLDSFLDEWHAASHLTNREARIEVVNEQVRGTVLGINAQGALRLREPNGNVREIIGGDVHVV